MHPVNIDMIITSAINRTRIDFTKEDIVTAIKKYNKDKESGYPPVYAEEAIRHFLSYDVIKVEMGLIG